MEMPKAYDKDSLVKALEKEGVVGGIDVVKKCVGVLADFLRSSAEMSKDGLIGKLDDFAIPGINYFEKLAIEKLSELEVKIETPAPVVPPEAPQA